MLELALYLWSLLRIAALAVFALAGLAAVGFGLLAVFVGGLAMLERAVRWVKDYL